ncbi:YeiH family protein [Sphingomonas sp. PR090111-T3T-6A]|uniref:YeiH family protein n=1 Tax=Sphingomonas sp. PR090111-T3T-6A TaxID=685778 RepID=UPI0003771269|nr:putative sulfate exporter family transporter [Sphingomonas sp. PR090111-T3T-6A]
MATAPLHTAPSTIAQRGSGLLPGIVLCAAVTFAALTAQRIEVALTGRAWLEALVLAILIGTAVRTAWSPGQRWQAGIHFSAKTLLELAVAMLGATISLGAIVGAGAPLVAGIVAAVAISITASFALGRLFGLPRKLAMLIACGNAICGNSAIAAVAPVIDAESDDVAASIAFTAVLGVAVVLLLPLIAHVLGLGQHGGGALAGLTVYAVPQVLAAAAPLGVAAVQLGTLVKLVRVLMLGPVVMTLSLIMGRRHGAERTVAAGHSIASITRFLPWFILAFLALAAARSLGLLPEVAVSGANKLAGLLTIVSMAALGLGVDLRSVAAAGPRVTAVVTLSLVILGAVALVVIRFAGIA